MESTADCPNRTDVAATPPNTYQAQWRQVTEIVRPATREAPSVSSRSRRSLRGSLASFRMLVRVEDSAPNTYRGSPSVLRRGESIELSRPRNSSVPPYRPLQGVDVTEVRSLSPGSGEGQSRSAK